MDEEKHDKVYAVETPAQEVVKTESHQDEEVKETTSRRGSTEEISEPVAIVPALAPQDSHSTSSDGRPKLLTKAAMKIFVPSQSAVASTVSATQRQLSGLIWFPSSVSLTITHLVDRIVQE
ncbi:unnamed protein product [Strongylus vulgaris]|uniref:Uncharacterized protein n=1 Tax=Strongylus vulgaris TaxID=40348 RepID=A0A3P7KRX6_STRVU|nr:unnamed protein product [Strongylus vulgaris]